jgi:hypothetical protein
LGNFSFDRGEGLVGGVHAVAPCMPGPLRDLWPRSGVRITLVPWSWYGFCSGNEAAVLT